MRNGVIDLEDGEEKSVSHLPRNDSHSQTL